MRNPKPESAIMHLLLGTLFSGLMCPIPVKRLQDRPLTSQTWPHIITAIWLENHKFGVVPLAVGVTSARTKSTAGVRDEQQPRRAQPGP